MPMIWLLPAAAFCVLIVVIALMCRRLCVELRATERSLARVIDATESVRDDLVRARAAIGRLDVPAWRQAAVERALGASVRWAARRVVPL